VVSIAAGAANGYARTSDGKVWAWGAGSYGQNGDNGFAQRTSAVQVSGITTASQIAAGLSHAYARLSDGSVKVSHAAIRGGDEPPDFEAYHKGMRDMAIVAALWTVGRLDDTNPWNWGYTSLLEALNDLVACPSHQDNPSHWGENDEAIACPRVDALFDVLARLGASRA
jgi:hypothetical protein